MDLIDRFHGIFIIRDSFCLRCRVNLFFKAKAFNQCLVRIVSVMDDYDIRPLWVGYDPWNSQYWVKEMEDMGFEMEKIRQGVYTLSELMKQLEADIRNHALNYDNNPIVK